MTGPVECRCGFRRPAGTTATACPQCGAATIEDTAAFDPRAASTTAGGPAPIRADHPPAVAGYEIDRELGRGGMGVVYRAREVNLNRPVALKVLLAGEFASAVDLARFQAEATAAAAVRHPNVVRVYAAGHHDGLPYLALELVPGGSLAGRLAGGPLPPAEAARVVQGVARGVQAAHDRNILHRDLKPANVLFDDGGLPRVADFGLARLGDGGLTASGAVMGTPAYMAPEQGRGETRSVGPAADVWALGVVLYECLVGRPPFQGRSAPETFRLVSETEPAPLPRSVPKDLQTIVFKCLEKDPAKRYPSAAAVADDLGRYLAGEPVIARPRGPAARLARWVARHRGPVYGAVGALVAAVAIFVVFRGREPVPVTAPVVTTPPPPVEPDEPAVPTKEGAVGMVQLAAYRMNSQNNLKQLMVALHNLHEGYGRLPPPAIYHPTTGQPLLSWRVAWLPHIDPTLADLHKQFKLTERWDSPHNVKLVDRMPRVFTVQNSRAPAGHTHYRMFMGPGTAYAPELLRPGKPFGKFGPRFADFIDGTANTMLIAEAAQPVPWTKPDELEIAPDRPLPALGGLFEGGFNAAIADGRIYFVSDQVSEPTLRAALTPRGNEVLGEEWPYGPPKAGTRKK